MNRYLFPVYRVVVPKPIRSIILRKNLRRRILGFYNSLPEDEIDEGKKEILNYLENNPVRIFPYHFHDKYHADQIEVLPDRESGFRYVLYDGKKLFFKKRWSEKRIQRAWSALLREQDPDSPHRYLTDSFTVGKDDIIADIGAAEGNFSLSVIEKVKKVYLFEPDREWIEALKLTFAPWSEKVEIINRSLSDNDESNNIRFDTFFGAGKEVTFLKIDVDGAESLILDGCKEIFESGKPLKVALCTYHKKDDEESFTGILNSFGFISHPSKGYMIPYYDKKIDIPYLRRGVIRATR